jgi:AcrR family transcriptional regulator
MDFVAFDAVRAALLTKSTIVRILPPMSKGEHTRAAILQVALAQASEAGFESLTIGTLADRAGLSKSGLFAHFGSREELQVAAIEAAAARFTETVFLPALKARRGLPRLRALFDHWLDWTARSGLTHGCPMQAAAVEFDDRPGPVRDAVVEHFTRLERELGRAVELAIGQGHLRADLDVEQFVFDMMGIIFAYYHGARLFEVARAESRARVAFERLVASASPNA